MRTDRLKPYRLFFALLVGVGGAQLYGCGAGSGEAEDSAQTSGAGGVPSTSNVTSGNVTTSTTGSLSGTTGAGPTGDVATADATVSGSTTAGTTTGGVITNDGTSGNATTGDGSTSSSTTGDGTTGATTTGDGTTSGSTDGTAGASTSGDSTSDGSTTGDATTTGSVTTGGSSTTGGMSMPDEQLVGWATDPYCGGNGTTGGGDAEPITVTDTQSLKDAMNSSDPQVIYVSGSIQTPGNISGRHNKTIIGINNAEIYGGWGLVGCTNMIVKNIKFRDGPNDSFGLSGSACVWIDHCEFVDGLDGNFDIVNGTDYVTISWSRFYYTQGHDHMLANLVGNTQPHEGDVGREKITYHHNWWGAGINGRKPRVRYGQVHIFNNYYHYTPVSGDSGDDYDIGAGFESKLLVENNYFDGSNEPITFMSDEGTAQVVERNNQFVNAGSVATRGSAFTPPYAYDHVMEPAAQVKDSVTAGAGVQ